MKIRIGLIVLLGSLALDARADDPGLVDRNYNGRVTDPAQVCMMKRTVQPHTTYSEEHPGKTYRFCCTACLTKFKADAFIPIKDAPFSLAQSEH